MQLLFVLALALLACVASFSVKGFRAPVRSMKLQMSEEPVAPEQEGPDPNFQPQDPKLFDMNRRVRLGRSRDQVSIFNGIYCFLLKLCVIMLLPLTLIRMASPTSGLSSPPCRSKRSLRVVPSRRTFLLPASLLALLSVLSLSSTSSAHSFLTPLISKTVRNSRR